MTAALTLLAGAMAVGTLAPRLLHRMSLTRRDPLPLIVMWQLSMAGVVLSATAGIILLLLPSHGPSTAPLALLNECWSAIQHGSPPGAETLAGLFGLVLLAAFTVRLGVVLIRAIRRGARKRREQFAMVRLAARREPGSSDTLWLAHDRPLAFSLTGPRRVVVATEGLTRHLEPAAVDAVFAHERAHLAGRHHMLVAVAEVLRAAVPFLPLFRQAPQAIGELVELAADTAAVRACGSAAVRSALLTVCGHGGPSMSLGMAQRAVDTRVARLAADPKLPGKLRRAASCGIAATTAVSLPFLVGTGLLVGLALLSCPVIG